MADVDEAPVEVPAPTSGAGELTLDSTGGKSARTSFHESVVNKDEVGSKSGKSHEGKPTVSISFRKQPSMGASKSPGSQSGTPNSLRGSLEVPRPRTSTAQAILAAQAAIAKAKSTCSNDGAPPVEAVVAVEKGWHLYGPDNPQPKGEVRITPASKQEAAKRKSYQSEKEALRARRLAELEARKAKEAQALAAAKEAKAAEHARRVAERRAKYEAFMAREMEAAAKSEASWRRYQQEKDKKPLYESMEAEWRARQAAEEEAKRAAYQEELRMIKMITLNQIMSGELNNIASHVAANKSRSSSPTHGRNSLGSSQELRSSQVLSPGAITRSSSPYGFSYASSPHSNNGSPKAAAWKQQPQLAAPALTERACSPIVFPSDGSTPPGCREMPTFKERQAAAAAKVNSMKQHTPPQVAKFEPDEEEDHQQQQQQLNKQQQQPKKQQQAEEDVEELHEEQQQQKAPSGAASRKGSALKQQQAPSAAASRKGSAAKQQQQQPEEEEAPVYEEEEEQQQQGSTHRPTTSAAPKRASSIAEQAAAAAAPLADEPTAAEIDEGDEPAAADEVAATEPEAEEAPAEEAAEEDVQAAEEVHDGGEQPRASDAAEEVDE